MYCDLTYINWNVVSGQSNYTYSNKISGRICLDLPFEQFPISAQMNIQFIGTFLVAVSLWCLPMQLSLHLADPNPTRQSSFSWASIPYHRLLYLCCQVSLFSPKLPKLFSPLALLWLDNGQVTKTSPSQEKQHICGLSFSSVALLQAFNHLGTKNYVFAIVRDITVYFRHGIEASALFAHSCVAMAVQR